MARLKIAILFIAIGIILLLLSTFFLSLLTNPNQDETPIDLNDDTITRIAIIDSGCGSDQTFVEVFQNFVTVENNYLYGEIQPYDGVGHGKYVCDIVHRIAPDARLFSAKIAGSTGEITFKGFFSAIEWAAETIKAHVINISIGTLPILSPDLEDIITKYVEEKGIIFSVSVGNDGSISSDSTGLGEWPAILPSTIGVGAINLLTNQSYSFSSWGRNVFGTFTTDFVADGSPPADKLLRGTSFSTPIITGYAANYREFLLENNIIPSPRMVQSLMVRYSSGYLANKFDQRLGWGQVRDIIESPLPDDWRSFLNSTYIFGGMHDTIPRFQGETFNVSWKVVTSNIAPDPPDLMVTGNASAFTILTMDPMKNWGSKLTAVVSVPENASTGWYSFTITPQRGRNLTFSFEVIGSYEKSILIDNSFSVNGVNFDYGQLWDLNLGLRNNGVLTTFTQKSLDTKSLNSYDVVVLIQPGSTSEGDSLTTFSNFNSSKFQQYIDYLLNGGNLFIVLDASVEPNFKALNDGLSNIDVYLDRKFAEDSSPMTVTDLEPHPVTDGVSSISASGYGVETDSTSLVEFGHVTYTVTDFFGSYTVTSSIGIAGEVNGGKFVVFSGYHSLTNDKIASPYEIGTTSLRLFLNAVTWMTS
ncbi:MAG: hypothetical protein D6732_28340 [Methanobacteriota archaeon]|nr:MAG: hypothetical protein D6732_28340 [Euryarchaeota archaeon]